MGLSYTISGDRETGERNVTVFVPGRAPYAAHSSHPRFEEIVEGLLEGDESVIDLFDLAEQVAVKFDRLSERVTVANGRVFFDGEEVHDAIAGQIVRFLDDGVADWKPLVNFLENLYQNPQAESREMLYNWIQGVKDDLGVPSDERDRSFTITPNGMIVGYKGVAVQTDEDTGEQTFVSINRGTAIVDGEVREGAIPNRIGSVIEMPRNSVTFDPENGCSRGLHVGTFRYARSFGRGELLEVHFNPRDVVSVPNDSAWEKVRVCRYKVVNTISVPYESPLGGYGYDDTPDDFEGDGCPDCGDPDCDAWDCDL